MWLFSYSVVERNILQTVPLSIFFSVFIFSMPSKVVIRMVTQFMSLATNIFWALSKAHFNPRLTARAKMSQSWAQNIFMPATINSII